jgi:hypothetical protein
MFAKLLQSGLIIVLSFCFLAYLSTDVYAGTVCAPHKYTLEITNLSDFENAKFFFKHPTSQFERSAAVINRFDRDPNDTDIISEGRIIKLYARATTGKVKAVKTGLSDDVVVLNNCYYVFGDYGQTLRFSELAEQYKLESRSDGEYELVKTGLVYTSLNGNKEYITAQMLGAGGQDTEYPQR